MSYQPLISSSEHDAMVDWRIRQIDNKDALRRFLDKDRVLCAYALGDLEEPYWSKSEFYGAESGGRLRGVALFYAGFTPSILTYFGEPEGLRAMRSLVMRRGPVHYILDAASFRAVHGWYRHSNMEKVWRMVVPRAQFRPRGLKRVQRLRWDYAVTLRTMLGGNGDAPAIDPETLQQGVFYGVTDGVQLISVAGTHVVAPGEGVGAVGYVFTAPEHRGKGYATACTAAVTKELLDMGLHTVVLNVAQTNPSAIHVYERLGFRKYCALVEGDGAPR